MWFSKEILKASIYCITFSSNPKASQSSYIFFPVWTSEVQYHNKEDDRLSCTVTLAAKVFKLHLIFFEGKFSVSPL